MYNVAGGKSRKFVSYEWKVGKYEWKVGRLGHIDLFRDGPEQTIPKEYWDRHESLGSSVIIRKAITFMQTNNFNCSHINLTP